MPMHQPVMQTVLVTDKASYEDGEEALITVSVTDGAGPVEGVAIHVEVANANGVRLAGGGTTGADGVASLSYKVNTKRDGVGTYSVDARVSKHGCESGDGSTAFRRSRLAG